MYSDNATRIADSCDRCVTKNYLYIDCRSAADEVCFRGRWRNVKEREIMRCVCLIKHTWRVCVYAGERYNLVT